MITVMGMALAMACPDCDSPKGEKCQCLARLHAASRHPCVIEATVDSLMHSNPYANRDASTEQEFNYVEPTEF